jgi:hypothetical protein
MGVATKSAVAGAQMYVVACPDLGEHLTQKGALNRCDHQHAVHQRVINARNGPCWTLVPS